MEFDAVMVDRGPVVSDSHSQSNDLNRNASGAHSEAYDRFIASMVIDYDKWHDGEGFDLAALDEMTDDERVSIARILKSGRDWRDVEALAHLHPPSVEDLRRIMADESAQLVARLRAGEELERLSDPVDFLPLVLTMLDAADGDLSVMSRVFDFLEWRKNSPPANDPRVKQKALDLLKTNRSDRAVNWAAIAFVLHGLCDSQYDWEHRPFWLRFAERADYDAAFAELIARIRGTSPK